MFGFLVASILLNAWDGLKYLLDFVLHNMWCLKGLPFHFSASLPVSTCVLFTCTLSFCLILYLDLFVSLLHLWHEWWMGLLTLWPIEKWFWISKVILKLKYVNLKFLKLVWISKVTLNFLKINLKWLWTFYAKWNDQAWFHMEIRTESNPTSNIYRELYIM